MESTSIERKHEAKLQKLTETDDIENFLTTFERMGDAYKWPPDLWTLKLAPLLTGKAQAAYANMDREKAKKYTEVKPAILKRYNINDETYRQRFRTTRPKAEESFAETEVRLRDMCRKWVKPDESNTEKVVDLIIMEQLLNVMPPYIQVHVREKSQKNAQEAASSADDFWRARAAANRVPFDRKKCNNCGVLGHLARDCKADFHGKSGSPAKDGLPNQRRDERWKTPATNGNKSVIRCFNCQGLGHIASKCPLGNKGKGNYFCAIDNRKSVNMSTYKSNAHSTEYHCYGLVEGKRTDILLDTGASRTLVHKELVPENKINEDEKIKVKCAHGDSIVYPTAIITIEIDGQKHEVKTGVSPTLPLPVLLGRDIGNLLELVIQEEQAHMVLTRLQQERAERAAATTLAKEIASGVKARKIDLTSDPTPVEKEDHFKNLQKMDDSLFQGETKRRKSKKEKRNEKKEWAAKAEEMSQQTQEEQPINSESEEQGSTDPVNDVDREDVFFELTKTDFQKLQQTDPTLETIRKSVAETSAPPSLETTKFFIHEGLMYRQWRPKDTDEDDVRLVEQLVLPTKCRKVALRLAHDIPTAGHLGRKKTLDPLLQRFYWPGIINDVADYCKRCPACQKVGQKPGKQARLIPLPIIEEPFRRIAMDIVGPLERTKTGHKYILVICNYATRYPEAVPLKNIEAETIAEELTKVLSRVGVPEEILTDQGANFMSSLLKEVYKLLGIKRIRTSPYHPQTDGLVERFNGTLKSMLRKLNQEDRTEWDKWLPYLLFAYREVPQASTGFSPFELLYGKNVRGPLDILRETWTASTQSSTSSVSYVLEMRQRMSEMMELVKENLARAQKKQKLWYDGKARVREFTEGQEVLVLLPTANNKLEAKWSGPYKITKKVGQVNYTVDMKGTRKRFRVFHVNMLREWHAPAENSFYDEQVDGDDIPDLFGSSNPQEVDEVTIGQQLNEGQKATLMETLGKWAQVIQDKPGRTNICEHRIETGDAKPVRQRPYRIPYAQREIMKGELNKMLEMGVIQPSKSEWASPVLMIPKKDGTPRFCVDFRQMNALSKFDAYPMARVDDIIDKFGRACFISTLDLTRGYWQVPLDTSSQKKAAFTTPFGLYEFLVMPFGLHGAPATFQRMMDIILRGTEEFAAALLDDVIIFSETWEEHIKHLDQIFSILKEAGLTAKPRKCNFGMCEVNYLGHTVGGGVVRPEPEKIKAITTFPRPSNKKEVRGFLGLSGYYRRFIPEYLEIAAPLSDLTKKPAPNQVNWTEACEDAFNLLKHHLVSAPVLASPDFERPFVVQTDASDRGVGAVLSQVGSDGMEHPVMYLSRKLLPREQKYATVEKECLAVIWAIKSLRVYLLGKPFTVETNHRALQWLDKTKETSGRLTRWSLSLQPYSSQIRYRKGQANANADSLSRMFKS